jgi:linoleoyl-CoA desaturase
MSLPIVKFTGHHNEEFYKVLRERVNDYFKSNKISRYANGKMILKTIILLALYLVPFVLLLTVANSIWMELVLWTVMGFGMAGVGLSVMHDANHGSYSQKESVNKLVGYVLFILGGSDVNWRIQHNILHHTYTNVAGMDEDINPGEVLRFSPHAKRHKIHRYQHYYAWFFYGLMTLLWFITKDYRQALRYKKYGLIETQKLSFARHMTTIIISKIIYGLIFIGLPIYLTSSPWWITIVGFMIMQFIAGLILAMIFQPAHVVPTSEYSEPDVSGNIEADWAINQMYNTANFAPKAKLLNWYVGGLNYQVEHHLFPNICHIHYSKIAPIVEQTAKEFNVPYHSYDTFIGALTAHTKMLRDLGRYDHAPAIH